MASTRFYLESSSDSDEEDTLPYPKPLARSAFLTPDFSPTTFLSSLHNRHQTLEDLRAELRSRSQELNKELLDLVNDNYQDFLGLGSSLRGGDEKLEEVRLGLLRFRREVDGMNQSVTTRRQEVEELVKDRRAVAKEIRKGRALLEISTRLEELEEALRVTVNGNSNGANQEDEVESDFTESDDSDEEEDTATTISITRLKRRVQQFVVLSRLTAKIGPEHPFVAKQEERITKVKQTLLLDLKNALAESRKVGASGDKGTLRLLSLYNVLDESQEALRAVKEQKR